MNQNAAAKTCIVVFWWLATALKEQNCISIGLSRKGVHRCLHKNGQRPEQPLWNCHHGQLGYCVRWWWLREMWLRIEYPEEKFCLITHQILFCGIKHFNHWRSKLGFKPCDILHWYNITTSLVICANSFVWLTCPITFKFWRLKRMYKVSYFKIKLTFKVKKKKSNVALKLKCYKVRKMSD